MSGPAQGGAGETVFVSSKDAIIVTRLTAADNGFPTCPDGIHPPLGAYMNDPEILGLERDYE